MGVVKPPTRRVPLLVAVRRMDTMLLYVLISRPRCERITLLGESSGIGSCGSRVVPWISRNAVLGIQVDGLPSRTLAGSVPNPAF